MSVQVNLLASGQADDQAILSALFAEHLSGKNPKLKRGTYQVTRDGIEREIILSHSIIKCPTEKGDRYYVVGRGKEETLGEGSFGKVKLSPFYMNAQGEKMNDYMQVVKIGSRKINTRCPKGEGRSGWKLKVEKEARITHIFYHNTPPPVYGVRKSLNKLYQTQNFYMFMPYLGKRNLQKTIDEDDGQCSFPERIKTILDSAGQVKRCHALGIIHRDIKPANFVCGESGRVFLHDFGSAKEANEEISESHLSDGTCAYMSPELYEKGETTTASDVHALGVSIGQIFGVEDFLSEKEKAPFIMKGIPSKDFYLAPYNFSRLKFCPKAYQKSIQAMLNKMTDRKPEKRPSLDKVITFFEDIKRAYSDKKENRYHQGSCRQAEYNGLHQPSGSTVILVH